MQGGFGDSGAPVFELLANNQVRLYGILRGGAVGDHIDFSPLSAIWSEITYVPGYQY